MRSLPGAAQLLPSCLRGSGREAAAHIPTDSLTFTPRGADRAGGDTKAVVDRPEGWRLFGRRGRQYLGRRREVVQEARVPLDKTQRYSAGAVPATLQH